MKFHPTPILDDNRNQLVMNSIQNFPQGDVQTPLPPPDFPISLENREESQIVEALETVNNAPIAPTAPVH